MPLPAVRQLLRASCSPSLTPVVLLCTLLPIAVGSMNINELMNINDVCKSATIFPGLCKLTLDLLTLKVVSETRVTWATCVPILVFLGLSILELGPMYATDRRQTDRQTDVRRQIKASLNAPA